MQRVMVGLTGGIASGKSTVAELLRARGAVIVDSDVLAREAVEPGTATLRAIRERFGADVLRTDGTLNRPRLGALVFSDAAARADLDTIVHPAVRARAAELAAAAPDGSVVVQVIPLLVETGQQDAFDLVVVVDVAPETQLRRLMSRNGLTRAEAEARVAAQATRERRLAVADAVIDNGGGLDGLEAQVDDLWERLGSR